MTDASTFTAMAPAPANTDSAPSRRYAPAQSDSGDAFNAALRDADRSGVARGEEPSSRHADKRDEDDKKKKRKGEGEAPSASSARAGGKGAPAASLHARVKAPDEKGGKADILSGLLAHPGGAQAAEAAQAPALTDAVDPAAFAQMLEQAAARAETLPPNQTLQVRFNDIRSPLDGVTVTRLPDGSLGMTLTSEPNAAPEVSKMLDMLRRRLEARGISLGELKLAEENDLAPESVEGAAAG